MISINLLVKETTDNGQTFQNPNDSIGILQIPLDF